MGWRHPPEAFLGHGEDAQLIDGAKAVLEGPRTRRKLEWVSPSRVQHGTTMCSDAGAASAFVLGHMPDHHDQGAAALLGEAGQLGCTLPVQATRRGRARGFRMHGLDRLNTQADAAISAPTEG